MKKILFLLLTTVLLSTTSNLVAQNAQGCDATRYLQDVFPGTASKTTVKFGNSVVTSFATGTDLYMDIYQPAGDTVQAKRPVIIWGFGGGFVLGSRADVEQVSRAYTKKGYVCAAIDYRLYPFLLLGYPDSAAIIPVVVQATQDMKAAVRFLRKDAATTNSYRIDPNNIIVGGYSAGAIAAMNVAALDSLDPVPAFLRTVVQQQGGFEGNSGNPGYSSTVKGAISFSGAIYKKEFIDAGDPPFFAAHATTDATVAYGYGTNVYRFYSDGDGVSVPYARSLGIPAVLVTVPAVAHTEIYNLTGQYAWYADVIYKAATVFAQKLVCGVSTLDTKDAQIATELVRVFPNPSNTKMTLDVSDYNINNRLYSLQVVDALGRTILTKTNQTANSLELNKSDIGAGIFFLQIRFEEAGVLVTKKIVFN
jgi:dienelactone hydrolase